MPFATWLGYSGPATNTSITVTVARWASGTYIPNYTVPAGYQHIGSAKINLYCATNGSLFSFLSLSGTTTNSLCVMDSRTFNYVSGLQEYNFSPPMTTSGGWYFGYSVSGAGTWNYSASGTAITNAGSLIQGDPGFFVSGGTVTMETTNAHRIPPVAFYLLEDIYTGTTETTTQSVVGQVIGYAIPTGTDEGSFIAGYTYASIFSSPMAGSFLSAHVLLKTPTGSIWCGLYDVAGNTPTNIITSGLIINSVLNSNYVWYNISGTDFTKGLVPGSYALAFNVVI